MEKRKEKDSMGEVSVPADKYWGAQTQRSKENFLIGNQKVPMEIIYAHAMLKKACALANQKLGLLDNTKCDLIIKAAEEIFSEKLDEHFPLAVWQTGSGTQSNMNVNEVIANRAIEMAGGKMGSKKPVHPNDDVNMSQSTNDTFPTSIHLACLLLIRKKLLPNLEFFAKSLLIKAKEFSGIIKVGRTHLMDATPVTLGDEFSGYAKQIFFGIEAVKNALPHFEEVPLGGTAVGTGINTHPKFAELSLEFLNDLSGTSLKIAENRFEAMSAKDACVEMSGALKQIAVSFTKIANDIRLYASGPRTGINELHLPENEPGSSIMPGKVNPTQSEAMTMVAAEVIGNDLTISLAGMSGQFQLNAYMPLIGFKMIESIHLIADMAKNFTDKCLLGITANKKRIQRNLEHNLILATALNRELGYDTASQIVKKAYTEHTSLKEAALSLKLLSENEFDEIVDPKKMLGPRE